MRGQGKTESRPLTAYQRQDAPKGALRLDANEGPSPRFDSRTWPLASEALRRYPDAADLEADLARRHGVQPDEVLVTAGGDDAIDRLCRRYLQGGRTLNLTAPTFSMFFHHARLAGGSTRTVPWWSGPYPVAAMSEAMSEDTGLVAVVSPNNPTGAVLTPEELAALRKGTGDRLLLLDAAYTEFGEIDLTPLALSLPNTLVLRTLSKAWGLAGLRVGYLLGAAPILKELRAWGAPYAVAGTSLALARQALAQGEQALQETISAVRNNRHQLMTLLKELGAEPQESQANFILCRPARADFLVQALGSIGVSVRGWQEDPELRDRVRITVPACLEEWETLEVALRAVLAPEALLLDMDGVIADEGPSYRETIIQVAAEAGVTLTRQDIAAAKAAGGANNDWELTRRLLADRGVPLSLTEVTRRFQDIYLGCADQPGLCERETLIPDRQVLQSLAQSLPLGIVTGRPRADAEAFLRRFNLEGLFQTVICLEDATPKPDPDPVNLALRNLGVQRAWMVGDTPDDIAAARGAGVLPLGITTPSPEDDTHQALVEAGAALILDSLNSLKEMLP